MEPEARTETVADRDWRPSSLDITEVGLLLGFAAPLSEKSDGMRSVGTGQVTHQLLSFQKLGTRQFNAKVNKLSPPSEYQNGG